MHKYITTCWIFLKNVGPNENCIFLGQTQQTTPNLKSNQQKEKWKQIFVNSKDKIILRMMTKHRKQQTSETKWKSNSAHMKK